MLRYTIVLALIVIVFIFVIEILTTVFGQIPTTPSTSTDEATLSQIQSTDVITPQLSVITGDIELGKIITMQVNNLSAYIAQTQKNPQTLVPYLNGRALNKLYPSAIDLEKNEVSFYLERTTDTKEIWLAVLRPRFDPKFWKVPIRLSLGFEGETPFSTSYNQQLYLTIFPLLRSLMFLCLLALFLAIVGLLAPKMLRDNNPITYSLARTLFVYWISIIVISFGFIYLITWDYNTLTGSVTILLGISASTTLGAVLIDSSRKPDLLNQVSADIIALKDVINTLPQGGPVTQDTIKKIDDIQRNVQNIIKDRKYPRHSIPDAKFPWEKFFSDILNDGNNISLQRFQIFVWSIVLGIIFVVSVVTNLTMPDFSETLLFLLGISSGTYLGLKTQEPPKN